jgi:hypothetical protein
MSYSHDKGYRGERPIELLLQDRYGSGHRPRAGSHNDVGDIGGLPIVISVKNHETMVLSTWVDQLGKMVARSQVSTGVVWHKRRGKGDPSGWYVTTTGGLFLPLLDSYLKQEAERYD